MLETFAAIGNFAERIELLPSIIVFVDKSK